MAARSGVNESYTRFNEATRDSQPPLIRKIRRHLAWHELAQQNEVSLIGSSWDITVGAALHLLRSGLIYSSTGSVAICGNNTSLKTCLYCSPLNSRRSMMTKGLQNPILPSLIPFSMPC